MFHKFLSHYPSNPQLNGFKSMSTVISHVLNTPFDQFASQMLGSGKAKLAWAKLSKGLDPLLTDDLDPLGLSARAKDTLRNILNGHSLIPSEVCGETSSDCGTKKLLVKMNDGQSIETVLIPSDKFKRTTICVSTQIGCDRGCRFCLTGKMGLLRNLTSEEIVSQVMHGIRITERDGMPPLSNVVYMGMGDAGRNIANVLESVAVLTDRHKFGFAQDKITVSTVGPSPQCFDELAKANANLAWSLHSADPELRQKLIPSSRKYSPVELRDALVAALVTRRRVQKRTVMIAVTLVKGVNDSLEDAVKVAEFVLPMLSSVPKVMVDLIPYNDIRIEGFATPDRDNVNAFQQVLVSRGIFCAVRNPRGNSDSSACGMLATKRIKRDRAKTVQPIESLRIIAQESTAE